MILDNQGRLLCFFGHHKCASSWIDGILKQVCEELQLKYFHANSPGQFEFDLVKLVETNKIDFFSYKNTNYDYIKPLKSFKGFHVVRDPRDIVVSGYFSHLYSHPTQGWNQLIHHREKLKTLSKEAGLLAEMEFSQNVFEEMYNWNYQLDNVMEIKMEELTLEPYNKFMEIFQYLEILNKDTKIKSQFSYIFSMAVKKLQKRFLKSEFFNASLKLPLDKALAIVYDHDFQKKTKGRKQGEEDIKSHYRKGVAGDWQNHFNQQHIDFFKARYNNLLLKLGYETDENW
jgi:hypothetical protein